MQHSKGFAEALVADLKAIIAVPTPPPPIALTLPSATLSKIDAVLRQDETRNDLLRKAAEAEIRRRSR